MIMKSKDDGGKVKQLFPPDEGRTKTLGVNLPPTVAQAIQRTGNRKNSISEQLLALIDPKKLEELLKEDAEHQRMCGPNKESVSPR